MQTELLAIVPLISVPPAPIRWPMGRRIGSVELACTRLAGACEAIESLLEIGRFCSNRLGAWIMASCISMYGVGTLEVFLTHLDGLVL